MLENTGMEDQGVRIAVICAVLGWVGAVILYVHDKSSIDPFDREYALKAALVHGVLWTLGGLAVLGWYRQKENRPFDEN